MSFLAVGIGGALGAVFRFILGETFQTTATFPYITMFINWSGSLFLAYIAGQPHFIRNQVVKLGVTTGLLGGFTTFSTFSIEAVHLIEQQQYIYGFFYVLGSGGGCVLFSYIGFSLARKRGEIT